MSTLSQRIATLKKARGDKLTAYEQVLQKAITEDRDVADDEQTALDAIKEDIAGLDTQIAKLEDSEKVIARAASPVLAAPVEREANRGFSPRVPAAPIDSRATKEWRVACRMDDYPAAGFTRMAIAMALAGPFNAHSYALRRWGSPDFADLVQQVGFGLDRAPTPPLSADEGVPGGGSLQPIIHMGSEFIDLLRAMLIIGRLPRIRRLAFGGAGTLLIPKQTGGVAGGYVGEGQSIRVERPNFDQLRLTPSKLAVIVPTTQELLRRSDPAAETLVRDDLLEGTARTMDTVFLTTTAALAGAPAGILAGIPENVAAQIDLTTPPLSVVAYLSNAMKAHVSALRQANIPMIAPAWIMNPRLKEFLRLFVTELGVFPWKAEIDAGVLLGYPIVDSTTVPLNWAGTAGDSIWVLLDAAQLLFAEDLLPTVDASEEASIQADDAPGTPPAAPNIISAFQQDMLFMRLRSSHTWNRRYDNGISWATTKE